MKRPLLSKLIAIGALILLLLIPIAMIGNSIEERQQYSETVVKDIARSSSYEQTLTGPVLVVPYIKTELYWETNANKEKESREREISGFLYFLPETLQVDARLGTELRQRGIYKAHLYHAATGIRGHFQLPQNWGLDDSLAQYRFQPAYVALGVSDSRGIKNALKLSWNQKELAAEPGTRIKALGNGVHIPVDTLGAGQRYEFALDLQLQGTGRFSLLPLGRETRLALSADWPHPSFIGDFLPAEREINAAGFNAQWQASYFSTNMQERFHQCIQQLECNAFQRTHFGVKLIDPVDQYVKSDRAIKYALLFIALTFAGFFLFEVLKSMQVHPVQYALVGLALAFFYLLLLSLSEHLGFGFAYLLSAIACVGLIGFYVSFVLQSLSRGLGFTAGLALLYVLLYGLLSAEDYALLMGSLLLFSLLGTFMALTRKVNWYSLGTQPKTLDAESC